MEQVEKKSHSLLILLCIYIIAIVVGVITVIIIPNSKVYGIIFGSITKLMGFRIPHIINSAHINEF